MGTGRRASRANPSVRVWTRHPPKSCAPMPRLTQREYVPPRDGVVLTTGDSRLFDLAGRLWSEGDPGPSALEFRLDVIPGGAPSAEVEREVAWQHAEKAYRVTIPGHLDVVIDFAASRVAGTVGSGLLEAEPALAARYILEAPAAVLLSRRGWQVLHAAAVTGPRGAAVVRGGAGAGKSTLVGAAFAAGLGVLADESLLVAREDVRDLSAAVRDLALLPDAAALLGLGPRTRFAFTGGEPKRRLDLFEESRPALRRASLAAPILLGDRCATPAALVPLSEGEFLAAFQEGEIPQEREAANPAVVARSWSRTGGFRLDGARDLPGAVALVASLVG